MEMLHEPVGEEEGAGGMEALLQQMAGEMGEGGERAMVLGGLAGSRACHVAGRGRGSSGSGGLQ